MTVLSRGARVRRGGRRPGWVLLTALLVLAMGASSALVFTNRVELLKLAVILALWAAVAGAFVSVLYRRQSDTDQSRVRDLKLVYDLQLDREISARREYELTVESQLRRELTSELRAQAADDVAALRAELAALRTSLEILFDTDLQHRPALETLEAEPSRPTRGRAYGDWERNGESGPADWVTSDRLTSLHREQHAGRDRTDEAAIIDVPEEPLLPPRQPRERERTHYEAPYPAPYQAPFVAGEPFAEPLPDPFTAPPPVPEMPPPQVSDPFMPPPPVPEMPPPSVPEPRFEPRHLSEPVPEPEETAAARWPGLDTFDPLAAPQPRPSDRRRRARHYGADDADDDQPLAEPPPRFGESGRRTRPRHSAEYRDYGVSNLMSRNGPQPAATPPPPPAPPSTPPPPPTAAAAPPPKLAAPLPPEPAARHRGVESPDDSDGHATDAGGQSAAELLARFHVEPSGGGRRRRRDG